RLRLAGLDRHGRRRRARAERGRDRQGAGGGAPRHPRAAGGGNGAGARRVAAVATDRVAGALNGPDKAERAQAMKAVRAGVKEELAAEFPEGGKDIGAVLEEIEYRTMREQVLEQGERIDGRAPDDIRAITCDVSVLPRTHGSALFTRGQTQALVTVTL